MTNQIPPSRPERSVLSEIQEGMKVYDLEQKQIGLVKEVRFGEANEEAVDRGLGPVGPQGTGRTIEDRYVVDTAFSGRVTSDDEISDDLAGSELIRSRMEQEGYIIIDTAGIFTGERIALTEWIETVSGEGVHLSVKKDSLLDE